MTWTIHEGDCLDILPTLKDGSIDLIMTSPPYAKRRMSTYGGIDPDAYVDWFLPIAALLHRVLAPSGSFVLNIKEHCENGERHTYVLDLIKALRGDGWLWTEEYIWHKTTPMPGRWPNRLKDGYERCLHFTKTRQFPMFPDAVAMPITESSRRRYQAADARNETRITSTTGSGFGKTWNNLQNRPTAHPSNVIVLACQRGNTQHSAAFPVALPDWFIRLFTQEGDTVLDPFLGSGTTGVAAVNLGRSFIGVEQSADYCAIARRRLADAAAQQPALFTAAD